MNRRGRPKHPDILTPREWEVLALIREGLSNEEIAHRLGISIDGAKYHVSEILGKLALENRSDAARWRPEAGRPVGEARPWWLAAGAPLLFWRRLGFRWLSPVLAGGLALAVAAGLGVLVWGLLATRGGGSASSATSAPVSPPPMSGPVAPASPTSTPAPILLPAGDRLAYIAAPSAAPEAGEYLDAGDLWVAEAGQPPRRLTDDGSARSPVWSPDGRRLLFFRGLNLWLMDAEGDLVPIDIAVASASWSRQSDRILYDLHTGGLRVYDVERHEREPIDTGVASASWSQQSDRILYQLDTGGLWVYDVERHEREQQPLPPDFALSGLAWSPDGRAVALARYVDPVWDRSQEPPRAQHSPDSTLWLLTFQEDGSTDLRRLFPRDELEAKVGWGGNEGPTGVYGLTWSPDGEWIGFQPMVQWVSAPFDGLEFLTVRRDGTGLVSHGGVLLSPNLREWAPDGHTLAITLGSGRDVSLNKTIAIVDPGAEGARRVGEDPARYDRLLGSRSGTPTPVSARSDAYPTWSPDGTRIAFQASEAGHLNVSTGKPGEPKENTGGKVEGPKEGIWVVDADGSDPRQLTSDPDYLDFYPSWSADGEQIMFVRVTPERAELWLMRSDGSDARPVVTNLLRIGGAWGQFGWDGYVAWYRAPAQ